MRRAADWREQLPPHPACPRPPRVSPLAAAPSGPVGLVPPAPPTSSLGGAAAGRSDGPSLGTPTRPDPRAEGLGAAGMGGERQHYYGKHGRQPPFCTGPGPWEGGRGKADLCLERAPTHASPASTPHPTLPRESLFRVPSKSLHPKGPSLKPPLQSSCGVPTSDPPLST